MRQISYEMTSRFKKRIAALWLAMVAGVVGLMIIDGQADTAILFAVCGTAVMYLLMRRLILSMMDAVWINGDDLVISKRGEEDRFAIANIVNVEGSLIARPEHIRLTVSPPSRFGQTICFWPPFRWFPVGSHPVARELIDRSRCFERQEAN
jgi:hypothetical protein